MNPGDKLTNIIVKVTAYITNTGDIRPVTIRKPINPPMILDQ